MIETLMGLIAVLLTMTLPVLYRIGTKVAILGQKIDEFSDRLVTLERAHAARKE